MITIAGDFAAAGVTVGLGWLAAEVVVGPGGGVLDAPPLAGGRAQDLPAVAATRAAYRALGKDPARYRPAAEALLRRVAQGKGLFRVSNVVDVNNLLSLETGFSIGTYDRAKLAPSVVLRRGRAGETYAAIGRGALNLEGLPVLTDALGPFGSPTSDSVRSMVDDATTRILMVVLGFAPALVEAAVLDRARGLLEAHCGARVTDGGLVAGTIEGVG